MSEEQRELIEAAVEKLERFSPRPVREFKMTITHEAGRFFSDSVLHLKSHDFRAKGEAMEPEFAVNEMVENLRAQLTKFKGKISGKQKGEEGGLGRAMLEDGGNPGRRPRWPPPMASSCGTWIWPPPRRRFDPGRCPF